MSRWKGMNDEMREHALALARDLARRASLLPIVRREAYLQEVGRNMVQDGRRWRVTGLAIRADV